MGPIVLFETSRVVELKWGALKDIKEFSGHLCGVFALKHLCGVITTPKLCSEDTALVSTILYELDSTKVLRRHFLSVLLTLHRVSSENNIS